MHYSVIARPVLCFTMSMDEAQEGSVEHYDVSGRSRLRIYGYGAHTCNRARG
jgi:hypothetical protein